DRVATEPGRCPKGHRRADPESPSLVRCSAHHTPRIRATAPDHDRFPAQLRMVALLDGSEERVEVHVQDRGAGHPGMMLRGRGPGQGSGRHQPFGSTATVTSGDMPGETWTATL